MRGKLAAVSLTLVVAACGSNASPEKTGTETFGCYVGSCVSPGVTGDDDADSGNDDGGASDASGSDGSGDRG